MRLRRVRAKSFRRFTDLTIEGIPETTQLVILAGPNGTGKSSLFDAFNLWMHQRANYGSGQHGGYHKKIGAADVEWENLVEVDFHNDVGGTADAKRKCFCIRSAYRNESDFAINELTHLESPFQIVKVKRLIDEDRSVSLNYRRLVADTVAQVYSEENDTVTVRALREKLIGAVRSSLNAMFPDLELLGVGSPLSGGTFLFRKGSSDSFRYLNLSGGEKAAFDLVLDLVIQREYYDDTIYCIDEPEAHLSTRTQRQLLQQLLQLLPSQCQLWLATHSIGMMRAAMDLQSGGTSQVVFLDFGGRDFDSPVVIAPAQVSRSFWRQALEVALDDVAGLIAPKRLVLCEGRPAKAPGDTGAEFDAACLRAIFAAEFPDTDFLSVGNSLEVSSDSMGVGRAFQTLVSGTETIRVIDRDDRSDEEVQNAIAAGIRVLSRRSIESYLLDEEILRKLCLNIGKGSEADNIITAKAAAMASSISRGNPPDDVKSAAGEIYNAAKRLLQLTQAGSNYRSFLRDTVAPLVPGTSVYEQLRTDLFGASSRKVG